MRTGVIPIVLLCLVAYAWVVHGFGSWNADSHLALTYAIVDRHTLDIDAYAEGLGDRASVGEHFYTDKLPLQSFMAVPVYAAVRTVVQPVSAKPTDVERPFIRYLLTLLTVSLPAALGVGLLFSELRRTGATEQQARLAALAYGLGSLVWPFATWYFSHALAATCVLATWVFARRGQARALIPASLAVMCEAPALLPIAPAIMLGCATIRPKDWRGLFGACLLAAIPVVLTATYATAVYGAPWRLGYEHLAGPEVFKTGMSAGIMGIGLPRLDVLGAMLFSPYRGLLVANPVLLMALPATLLAVRRRSMWEGAMLLTFAACTLVMSGYAFWDGGASIGPRHVVSALPLVFLASGRVFRGFTAHVLTAVSIALMLLALNAGSIFVESIANPWQQLILPAAIGQAPTDMAWPYLIIDIPGLWSWMPIIAAVILVWPVPGLRFDTLFGQLPEKGDITEAEIQQHATTWWKRSDRRGDRARGAHVLYRLALRRPGNAGAAG